MTVACPAPEWPGSLATAGPPEDPTILLRGQVAIGATRFALTAMRVDPIRYGPDFRDDLDRSVYAEFQLAPLLDLVSELVGVAEPSTLRLGTGEYLVWMVPTGDSG
jgi:hypothetical protein